LLNRSVQQLKDDIKAGRTPMRGVNLGGWLVGEYWMTAASPAWSGVPNDIANHGEYKTMEYLGMSHLLFIANATMLDDQHDSRSSKR
jgi:hypothetical protein